MDNLFKVISDNREIDLLSKGIKCNVFVFSKNQIIVDVINAKAAVKTMNDPNSQNNARVMVNNKLNNILRSYGNQNGQPYIT